MSAYMCESHKKPGDNLITSRKMAFLYPTASDDARAAKASGKQTLARIDVWEET